MMLGILLMFQTLILASEPSGAYKTIVDKLTLLETLHPMTAKTFSLGKNDDNTDVMAIRVSLSPAEANLNKVAHIVVATHHGNETHAPLLAMKFLASLIEKYESPQVYQSNLANTEWTIVPVLNVTGYNTSTRWEYGQDPNRDYPGPCNPSPGGKLGSVRTLMNHLRTRVYTGSVTIHGYIGVLAYPWGVDLDNTHTLDHNQYAAVTSKAARINGYQHGTSTDLIYPALGTYEDYAYWKHGLWSLLVELENGSQNDINLTSDALTTYFDGLDQSPSATNQLTGNCLRSNRPDLHNE